jgi:hypothetical protein
MLDTARTYAGTGSDELLLADGESLFFTVEGAGLIEERRGPGHWEGGSQGVSVPVASLGGRTVRYRVGASRGHWVRAPRRPRPSTEASCSSPTGGWCSPAPPRPATASSKSW